MSKPFNPKLIKHKIPAPILDLIAKGYIKDYKKRPTILEYIQHPVFDNLRKKYQIVFNISHSSFIDSNKKKLKKDLNKIVKCMQNIE